VQVRICGSPGRATSRGHPTKRLTNRKQGTGNREPATGNLRIAHPQGYTIRLRIIACCLLPVAGPLFPVLGANRSKLRISVVRP